ncbi:hypothetical protein [Pedobacter miscanthi]|uniref:Uncharacterized protein n=1 Tax=Pedobacter miscanthi TaxID=2259170 RepID=A0A366KSS8_9SPHI|nr:hypothetical protein [Pedobacter miscanthi]RBQ04588.1 hypothetical protein DRW42_18330 [Pedobacter miscanthi]
MALIHFIFELFKILIQSAIYSSIIFFGINSLVKPKPGSFLYFFRNKKMLTWVSSWGIISFGLFFFMFSYYGDHGLGDSARIPIGHHREISQTDIMSHIEPKNKGVIYINEFSITDDYVYGTLEKYNLDLNQNYFVYDLKLNTVQLFDQAIPFNYFLTSKNVSQESAYQTFNYHYNQYWNGWRFWLLP